MNCNDKEPGFDLVGWDVKEKHETCEMHMQWQARKQVSMYVVHALASSSQWQGGGHSR